MQVATVYKGTFRPLIDSIKHAKHMPADKRIIAINQHNNVPRTTMIMNGIVNILQRIQVVLIDYDLNLILRKTFLLDILFHILPRSIRWHVVNIHDMEVVVLLHEDWVQVAEVELGVYVVVGGRDDAERQLGWEVGFEIVLLLVELLLGGEQLLYSLGFGLLVPVVGCHLYLDLALKVDIVRDI